MDLPNPTWVWLVKDTKYKSRVVKTAKILYREARQITRNFLSFLGYFLISGENLRENLIFAHLNIAHSFGIKFRAFSGL